jgi:hypothetical protein
MGRKMKERCSDPNRLDYWRELLGDCKKYNDISADGWLFGYLTDTYTAPELEKLKEVCKELNLRLVLERQGGSVYLNEV